MAITRPFLLLVVYLCTALQNSDVSGEAVIKVEGGSSLVGETCPNELISLVCNAVDATFLQWRYSDEANTVNIVTYTSTDPVNVTMQLSGSPAFESVVLLNKSVNEESPTFSNFTSVLTVNTSQLKEQGISEMECGDSAVSAVEIVNITIIQQSQPPAPNITEIEAVYQNTLLEKIKVSWQRVPVRCLAFESSLMYEVSGGYQNAVIPHSTCEDLCSVTLNISASNVSSPYVVTVSAVNDIGSAPSSPVNIAVQSGQYLSLSVSFKNCITSVQCVSSIDSNCTLLYSHGQVLSSFGAIESNQTRGDLLLEPDTTFIFVATVNVINALRVTEMKRFTTGSFSPRLSDSNTGQIIAGVVLLFLGGIFLLVAFICFCKRRALAPRTWKIPLAIGLTVVSLLLLTSVALWIAVAAVVGPQEDTCDLDWQQTRDALVLSALVLSCLVCVTGLVVMMPAYILCHATKGFSLNQSKEELDTPAPEVSRYQRVKNWVVQSLYGETDTSASTSPSSRAQRASTQRASTNATWWGWFKSKLWSTSASEAPEYDKVSYNTGSRQREKKYDPTPGYDQLYRSGSNQRKKATKPQDIPLETRKAKQPKASDRRDNKHDDEEAGNAACSVQ